MTSERPGKYTGRRSTRLNFRRIGSRAECLISKSEHSRSAPDRTPCASRQRTHRINLRSIRFFSRARTTEQRGYVLISAIALAILYFGLMELMLIDSSRALREAQRFRARVTSAALAESAAELAAAQMVSRPGATATAQDEQGQMSATLNTSGNTFEITGEGSTTGVVPMKASVRVQGRIEGTHIAIDYTFHSQ